ncbi:chemotaxis protein CheA [Alkalihalobacillus trypoxylicola]|uniref:Chemotaxis protein CheA n=1 Tax=Alkalihalobacillus trypoxylicola TaxID=519424 RepID=A0A162EDS0_9BACI|nr:chemotaxis protein CheA [Alkalihalobacillus trypoxylicola]KYG32342.1 chemotaxis protein CheA [Alkalihalobacillus trypoxylicola]
MINSEYLDVFLDESQEHLQSLNDHVLLLEKEPTNLSIVGEIFRSAHTLKGMAATMGFEDLAQLTHHMENVLDLIRNEKLQATTNVLDVVFSALDDLEEIVMDISNGGEGKKDVTEMIRRLEEILGNDSTPIQSVQVNQEVAATAMALTENHLNEDFDEFERTVLLQSLEQDYSVYILKVSLDPEVMLKAARVFMVFEILEQSGEVIKANPSTEKLEDEQFELDFQVTIISKVELEKLRSQILKVSEISSVHIESLTKEVLQPSREEETITLVKNDSKPTKLAKEDQSSSEGSSKKASESNKTIRVNIERLDKLMNLFEELVIDRGRLEQISSELKNTELHDTVERMSRISSDLQEIILTMRMMPVDQVFNRFPRMLRNLAKELKKEVNLEIVGAETELDRTIIDEVGDPLVHLLRNSIDHGIETPQERLRLGKPKVGTITLRAFHSGNNVFIEIEDDGAGIDRDKVLQKALDRGVVTEADAEKMSDQQVFSLLFSSGFSTAEQITDISGRGVGLDVVRNTFESLGGSVTVHSTLGKGSTFSVQLPLTLSIIDVMLVEVGVEKYAIPLSSIVETAIVDKNEIYQAHNQKVIDFRGKVVPLVFLKDVFEVPNARDHDEFYSLVIIQKGNKVAGLVVDALIGQHDIVLKSIGQYLSNIFAISGATILGDGQVALIIDSNALIKS